MENLSSQTYPHMVPSLEEQLLKCTGSVADGNKRESQFLHDNEVSK